MLSFGGPTFKKKLLIQASKLPDLVTLADIYLLSKCNESSQQFRDVSSRFVARSVQGSKTDLSHIFQLTCVQEVGVVGHCLKFGILKIFNSLTFML